jgi:hypothetical protein
MRDLTFYGLGIPLKGPYTFAFIVELNPVSAAALFHFPFLAEHLGRRAPWIYYSRNISTTTTRP